MRSIQELNLAIDELTKELEHTKNEKAKFETQVGVLTEERNQLTKDLEYMTHLNDLNFNEVQKLVEENKDLLDKNRSLFESISQIEKRLAQTKETVTVLTAANDAVNQDNKTLREENEKLKTVNQESGKLLLLGYEALANAMIKIK